MADVIPATGLIDLRPEKRVRLRGLAIPAVPLTPGSILMESASDVLLMESAVGTDQLLLETV